MLLGCKDKAIALILRNLIQTSYFRVIVVDDVDSVECCGALKVKIIICKMLHLFDRSLFRIVLFRVTFNDLR